MRIAMLCREMPPVGGGAGAVALQLSRQLVIAGHEVDLITMHYGDQSYEETVDGIRIVRIPCGRRSVTSARLVEMARFLRKARTLVHEAHAARPYDVIHAHSILPEGAIGTMRGLGVRTVVTAHGSDVPGYNPDRYDLVHRIARRWWVRTLERTDVVTAPSAFLAGLIRDALPSQSVSIIPNGITADLFEDRAERDGILIVSRLVPRKNVHLTLEALNGLPATTVDIVGDGPELPRLRSIAATLPEHEVRFHGWLEHGSPAWREVYERARFFVFMSSQENFPVNLLEAQLAGLVTIASDIPSNREVLGNDAEFVDIDVGALRSRLASLMDQPQGELVRQGQRARERICDDFLWPRLAERYEHLYVGAEE